MAIAEKDKKILESVRKSVGSGWKDGWTLSASKSEDLRKKFDFKDEKSWMVKLAGIVLDLCDAPVSDYQVGIVGKENSGALIFGGNLEFAGESLGLTVHAEQFLFSRAFHRGGSIVNIALDKPTPCGHCRQFITEFSGGKNVRVHNAQGFDLRIADLLPFNFGPEQLGAKGIEPSSPPVKVTLQPNSKIPTKLESAAKVALDAASRSYAPYSKSFCGVALKAGKEIVPGSYIENAAFNPSLSPLHSAIINLLAAGHRLKDIDGAVLVGSGDKVDFAPVTAHLLSRIAPKATLAVLKAK